MSPDVSCGYNNGRPITKSFLFMMVRHRNCIHSLPSVALLHVTSLIGLMSHIHVLGDNSASALHFILFLWWSSISAMQRAAHSAVVFLYYTGLFVVRQVWEMPHLREQWTEIACCYVHGGWKQWLFSELITLRQCIGERHVICQTFSNFVWKKCKTCMLVHLNILCPVCRYLHYTSAECLLMGCKWFS